jgi:hypothetical protein
MDIAHTLHTKRAGSHTAYIKSVSADVCTCKKARGCVHCSPSRGLLSRTTEITSRNLCYTSANADMGIAHTLPHNVLGVIVLLILHTYNVCTCKDRGCVHCTQCATENFVKSPRTDAVSRAPPKFKHLFSTKEGSGTGIHTSWESQPHPVEPGRFPSRWNFRKRRRPREVDDAWFNPSRPGCPSGLALKLNPLTNSMFKLRLNACFYSGGEKQNA